MLALLAALGLVIRIGREFDPDAHARPRCRELRA
jgi:hypothetical protein